EAVVTEDPTNTKARHELARAYNNLGILQLRMGKPPAEALRAHQRAGELREQLAREAPDNAGYKNDLARSYHNLARVQAKTGQRAEALRSLERARTIREELVKKRIE